jgi:hypothetical protein
MAMLGDPVIRPDEDECLIPTSYAMEASRREWEETAAVSWAMSRPPNTGPKEVEAAIRAEFHLRPGDVVVTSHHPQAFLIKFQHRHHCTQALKQGYAKRHGIDIHFGKWRSLANCLCNAPARDITRGYQSTPCFCCDTKLLEISAALSLKLGHPGQINHSS